MSKAYLLVHYYKNRKKAMDDTYSLGAHLFDKSIKK